MFHLKICKETIYDEIKRILRVLIIFCVMAIRIWCYWCLLKKEKLRIEGIKISRWNAYFIKKTANDNSNNFNNKVIASRSIYIMV